MQIVHFTFAGHTGTATRNMRETFVSWGGMNFQIEAAKPALREAIEAAFSNQQANRRAYMRGLSRNARRAQYDI